MGAVEMKCEDALLLMNSVLDGEAGEEEEQVLRFHLNGCPDCRQAMLISRSISNGIRELGEPEPPEDLLSRITSRLEKGDYDRSPLRVNTRSFGHWKIAAALPFAAAFLLLFWNGFSGTDRSALTDHPSVSAEETVNYAPAPVMAYSRPSSVTTF
jgi:predicted anti-sigma-YlaC factor YlaD